MERRREMEKKRNRAKRKNEPNGGRGVLYINFSDGIIDKNLLLSVALNSFGN
jgi:hypothetical protein